MKGASTAAARGACAGAAAPPAGAPSSRRSSTALSRGPSTPPRSLLTWGPRTMAARSGRPMRSRLTPLPTPPPLRARTPPGRCPRARCPRRWATRTSPSSSSSTQSSSATTTPKRESFTNSRTVRRHQTRPEAQGRKGKRAKASDGTEHRPLYTTPQRPLFELELELIQAHMTQNPLALLSLVSFRAPSFYMGNKRKGGF
mmetsp:Transcript_38641/g.86285  ORF Transcript_38641/g.86285 Transcript_38641/m.86285 type:complete len:200 (+) Transcript_38641:892-1491(+)